MPLTVSYLKFLFRSVNAHGIHSPFVYNLVTKGFYRRRYVESDQKYDTNATGLSKEALNILFKTISHFKSYKLLALGTDTTFIAEIIRTEAEQTNTKVWFYSTMVPVPDGVDLAYLSGNDEDSILPAFKQALQDINNNSVVAIGNIHRSADMETAWETIKKDPNVTLTIDTYHLGLVFFRREQTKQPFIIRPFKSTVLDVFLGIKNLWGLLH
ncbi:hypothetical protein FMM05_13725 [Flavobacterium zepuense]|uniref:Uncharacterized protein n=1 Tax=Flavobacterium zepuense TaxID=2593302 RepID=A0A552UYE9_9FLAO|nr:hypothetical protein [Flavobacterium zepuense]TRW23253.1 hypothetical protein FMM05_13725 [Flavobacterium zepuense]